MSIINRFGDMIKSYLNDEDEGVFGKFSQNRKGYSKGVLDPDVEAAYQELNDYLKGGSDKPNSSFSNAEGPSQPRFHRESGIPESIKQGFAELGLSPGASPDECKAAYKKLLKIHHPDRHTGHPANMQKATEKTARINEAFDRIEQWRQTGKSE
ncbi:MAG: J domain-containing protein [Treponema sp.]|jgi:hypothetical protein|nr:J domain-containing protein [Treponema sp.]